MVGAESDAINKVSPMAQGFVYILVSPNSNYIKISMKSEMPCIRVQDQRSQLFWGTSALWLPDEAANVIMPLLRRTL